MNATIVSRMSTFEVTVGVATSVREIRHDAKELDLTESDTGHIRFLLSFGCNRSGYY